MANTGGNWIAAATKHAHRLHEHLGVPMGTHIPMKMLNAAAKKKGVVGKEARLAITLSKMRG